MSENLIILAMSQPCGSYMRTMTLRAAGMEQDPRTGTVQPLGTFALNKSENGTFANTPECY
jgi:hypothetical protein